MAKNTIIRPTDQRLVMWLVAALIKKESLAKKNENRNPFTGTPFYVYDHEVRIPLPFPPGDDRADDDHYFSLEVRNDGSYHVTLEENSSDFKKTVAILNFQILGLEGRFDRPLDITLYNYWVGELSKDNSKAPINLLKEVNYGN